MAISVIVPLYNEEDNVKPLYTKLTEVLKKMGDYEILSINDGSTDSTLARLKELAKRDKRLRIISFSRNFGKTPGLQAGIDNARGDVIVTIDGDLQNDPDDIPKLVEMLRKGNYGVVSGWRYQRDDPSEKRVFSGVHNWLARTLTGLDIHDSNCGLKAYRADALKRVRLYGEMHRYIPALIAAKGYRVGEMKVRHHPRRFGKSKYGKGRLLKGFLDLLYVKFWSSFSTRPLHLFGGFGVVMALIGGLIGAYKVVVQKLLLGIPLQTGPQLLLAVTLLLLGFQFIVFGVLAEIMIRTYYDSTDDKTYTIEELV